jgi:multidrug efflux pump subunit AcrA (membrane-fusion protein)
MIHHAIGRRAMQFRHVPLWLLVVTIILTLALNGCRPGGVAPESADTAPPAPSAITMAVSAAKVSVSPMRRELRLLGTTVATRHLQLRAPSAGRVLDFNLQNGDRVRRGQVIAQVLNREVEAATNGLAVAQRLDPAEAPALEKSVKRYSHGSGVPVVSPEDAIVSQRLVSTGQMVNDMDPLADLIDPRSIYVEAAVPIDDLELIRPGMTATISSPMASNSAMPARVAALSPSLSPNGATAPARLEFTSAERVTQAGAPVEINLAIDSVADAIVIPKDALFEDAAHDSSYVFVAGADGRAHRTPVTTGIRSGNQVQAISGVKPGDLVVTSGGYALADGLAVKVAVANP